MSNVKLITMMVLMIALITGSALAGDMEWKFYGKLHSSINMMNDSEDSKLSMSSNTSRFGFKGAKVLNDNLNFIWQFESKLDMVEKGGETLANRNSFVGLKGNWGTALAGIHDTPYKTLGRKTTFFFDSVGDNRQIMGHVDDRTDDYIMFISPNFDAFSFRVGYEFDQNAAGAPDAANSFAGMATYAKDEFLVGFAYETLTMGNFAVVDPESEKRMRFAGKYDAEQFALAATYQMLTDNGGVLDANAVTMGGEALYKATPVVNIKAGYYIITPDEDTFGADVGANLVTFGADYNYVKNVQFYVQYAGMMNADNGYWGMGDYNGFGDPVDAAALPGETLSGFSIGTNIKF
ncbi:MAG: porin [Gemmatimonadales bacterium]|nr:porin [Gemmatimonadales bacterium]